MLLTTLLIVIALIGIGVLGLAVQIIFKKDHKFPEINVGGNKNMKKRGITCAQSWDKMEQRKVRPLKYEKLRLDNDNF